MKIKFMRADTPRLLRLGKKRRKLQKWRRPRGKHNKLRLKRVGYPVQPGVGFKGSKISSGMISNLNPVLIHNLSELQKLNKTQIAIIARIGAKKKLDIVKKAQELNIKIANLGGKS